MADLRIVTPLKDTTLIAGFDRFQAELRTVRALYAETRCEGCGHTGHAPGRCDSPCEDDERFRCGCGS